MITCPRTRFGAIPSKSHRWVPPTCVFVRITPVHGSSIVSFSPHRKNKETQQEYYTNSLSLQATSAGISTPASPSPFSKPLSKLNNPSDSPPFVTSQYAAQSIPISGNATGHTDPFDLTGLPVGPFPQNNGWHSRGIGAMAGCVLSAVLGWVTVASYSLSGGNGGDGGGEGEGEGEDEGGEGGVV